MIDTEQLKSSVKYNGDSMSVTFGSNIPYHGPIQGVDFGWGEDVSGHTTMTNWPKLNWDSSLQHYFFVNSSGDVIGPDSRTQEQREFDEAMEELEAWLSTPST